MPRALNPETGFLVNANNQVIAGDYPYLLTGDWAGPNRARRIIDLLAADADLSLEEMSRIQADTYSILAEELCPYLLALEPVDEVEAAALAEVERWDRHYRTDSVGAPIYHVWHWHLVRNVVGDELGEELLEESLIPPLLEHQITDRLMAEADHPWFDDRGTPEIEGRDEIAARSLSDAVAWLVEHHGDDPEDWQWGELHPMSFAHLPFGQSGVAPLERLFNSTPVPAPGGPFTVFATHPSPTPPFKVTSGTSQRFLADLADLSRSLAANSTGQSGHAFHRHVQDQVQLWQKVEYHPVLFDRAKVEAAAEEVMTLTPP